MGLPEQGYFDWVDQFLQKNPGYVELSDRKIIAPRPDLSVGDGSEAGGVLPGCSRRTLPFSWETNQGLLILYGRAQQKSHIAY